MEIAECGDSLEAKTDNFPKDPTWEKNCIV